MSKPQSFSPPTLSVVIPMLNEAGNVAPLIDELVLALAQCPELAGRYEILAVDDGSADATTDEIRAAQDTCPNVRLLRHSRRMGMSAAIRSGVRASRAPWILTIDGDGQNDPADIPALCALAWQNGMNGKTLVAGLRVRRADTWAKRIASRFANGLRRALLRDACPDTGCSLKLFPRESYLALPFFSGLHRFMPALMKHSGHTVVFMTVHDRPRRHGVTKSDFLGRAVMGFFDLFGVLWLMRRTPAIHGIAIEESPALQRHSATMNGA